MGKMRKLTVQAPAKINLHLQVNSLRSDGFHGVRSIFLALSFGDTLHFETIDPAGRLEIRMNPAIPIEKNIIFRAVLLFREAAGFDQGLRIRVDKRIPMGAGLGGGSSDAAAALLALNTLAASSASPGHSLDRGELAALAAALGSDVPFFLNVNESSAAWVSGRGEKITPVAAPENVWIVLAYPGFSSETARAFRLLDEFRLKAGASSEPGGRARSVAKKVLIGALEREPRTWPFENDFLPVFLRTNGVKTAYRKLLEKLREEGAEFASLSGAGSACFGIFSDRKSAFRAQKNLLKDWEFVNISLPLANES
ncbi:MAG TPA: 4-(cytidine 5'-diphospho)-2-C-methyl-D-erythritol kinase [Treponema sp.]|nr:4-(cytidine 5'-diphospho)-2-C-methyl-D-erythritol kinase [Treponema sp.]